jgi:hypothetical protein
MWAGLRAGRRFADGEPLTAHIAFADDAFGAVVLGHVVRASQRAIAAAEALIVEMADDAGERIFLVSIDRARLHASRLQAVMAGRGDVLDHRQIAGAAVQEANVAKGFVVVEAVLVVTRGDAGFATRAEIKIDLKGVLFADLERCGGQQVAVRPRIGLRHRAVALGKTLDGRQFLLLAEQVGKEVARFAAGVVPSGRSRQSVFEKRGGGQKNPRRGSGSKHAQDRLGCAR